MLVKNWMSKKVITVDTNASMQDAIETLKENNIRFLPVMKKRKLVGVVTDKDLKRASASDATTLEIHELLYLLSKIKLKDIMSKDVIVVPFERSALGGAAFWRRARLITRAGRRPRHHDHGRQSSPISWRFSLHGWQG